MGQFQPAQRPHDRLHGAIAGAAGGLIGTLAMNYAQRLWTLAVEGRAPAASAADEHDARDWQERSEQQNANELAAQALATATVHRRLTSHELSVAARIVHFAFGAAVGALHGLYAQRTLTRRRTGVALGTALWLTADEIAMPLMGLSKSTLQRPLEMHLQSFVAHIVYGVTTENVRHAVRSHQVS